MLTIYYSCEGCGLKRVECKVHFRLRDQDVLEWMEKEVGMRLASNHKFRSPFCHSVSAKDVLFEVTGMEYIGGPYALVPVEK